MRMSVLAVLIIGLAGAAEAQTDWPMYGHDLANSRDGGAAGPSLTQVGSITQPTWTFKASTGDFTGTPVLANGVLVAGNNGGFVYAIDAVSGKMLWSKNVGQPINGSAAIDPNASGGPTVFVPVAQMGSPRLLALSLKNGAARWDKSISGSEQD